MSKKKKIIVSVVMVLLLGATAYLNLSLTSLTNPSDGNEIVTTSNFFSEYRTERTATREEEMLYLDSIIANTSLSSQTVQTAVDQKLNLVESMETEMVLEGLIKAKGFEDVAITMGGDSESINVIVKTDELSQDQVAQIYSVLVNEVSATQNNIKIIPIS